MAAQRLEKTARLVPKCWSIPHFLLPLTSDPLQRSARQFTLWALSPTRIQGWWGGGTAVPMRSEVKFVPLNGKFSLHNVLDSPDWNSC